MAHAGRAESLRRRNRFWSRPLLTLILLWGKVFKVGGAVSECIICEARMVASCVSRERDMQVSSLSSALCLHRGVVWRIN